MSGLTIRLRFGGTETLLTPPESPINSKENKENLVIKSILKKKDDGKISKKRVSFSQAKQIRVTPLDGLKATAWFQVKRECDCKHKLMQKGFNVNPFYLDHRQTIRSVFPKDI